MLNYIKAELYRNFNRTYFWAYTGGIAILTLIMNILMKISSVGQSMNLVVLIQASAQMLMVPVFLVVSIVEMVTAEEQKNLTFKNVLSFGLSRNKFVLSKIIAAVILSLISAIIILTVFFGSGTILLGVGEGFSASLVSDFMGRMLVSTILWIACISVGTFLALTIKNNTIFGLVYATVFLVGKKLIGLLSLLVSNKFEYVQKILITTQLDKLKMELTSSNMTFAALVGVAYIIVFTALTMMYIKNKEIK